MSTAATKTFVNYKEDILSFEVANERFLGIIEPGLLRGFDTLVPITPLQFGLWHTSTGIKKIAKDGDTEVGPCAVVYTPQGTIAHFEEPTINLVVPANTDLDHPQITVIYFFHEYLPTENPPLGQIQILTGNPGEGKPTLPNPKKQIELGYITMPADTDTVAPSYWTPSTAKGIGGRTYVDKAEFDEVIAGLISNEGDEVITGEKTFDQIRVVAPVTGEPIDVGHRLNNKFLLTYTNSQISPQSQAYIVLAVFQEGEGEIQTGSIKIITQFPAIQTHSTKLAGVLEFSYSINPNYSGGGHGTISCGLLNYRRPGASSSMQNPQVGPNQVKRVDLGGGARALVLGIHHNVNQEFLIEYTSSDGTLANVNPTIQQLNPDAITNAFTQGFLGNTATRDIFTHTSSTPGSGGLSPANQYIYFPAELLGGFDITTDIVLSIMGTPDTTLPNAGPTFPEHIWYDYPDFPGVVAKWNFSPVGVSSARIFISKPATISSSPV